MKMLSIALFAGLAAVSGSAAACNDHAPGTEPGRSAVGRESAWIAGEVRDVDLEDGTITLGHGKIARPRMDAMTSMLVKARDPKAIADAKPGDKVRFRLAMAGDQPVLTRIDVVSKR
jgi:Cu/Ag efflux protein CusF